MTAEQERAELHRAVSLSFEKDEARAKDSYTNHTATALRRRVLAAQNGHA